MRRSALITILASGLAVITLPGLSHAGDVLGYRPAIWGPGAYGEPNVGCGPYFVPNPHFLAPPSQCVREKWGATYDGLGGSSCVGCGGHASGHIHAGVSYGAASSQSPYFANTTSGQPSDLAARAPRTPVVQTGMSK